MTHLSIGEAARLTGLSAHTLRYYERIGLLDPVGRDGGGRRRYREADLTVVAFLQRLRATGMPIRRMLEYARLVRQGAATVPERRAMLEAHRCAVAERLAELTDCLAVIDAKIATYGGDTTR